MRAANEAEGPGGWRPGVVLGLLWALLALRLPGVWWGRESLFFRDFGTLGYPFVRYARESFWRGEWPLWNPLSNCGTPFLAQWNTLALYPFSLIYLLFPLPWSLNYFCLAHLLLGGLGAYLLARRWTRDAWAGAFAGVSFMLGGPLLSSHIYPNYLVALGWMPLTILWAERAWQEGGRWIAGAAVAGTMQMLSGAPELIVQTWVMAGALWVGEHWRRGGGQAGNGSRAAGTVRSLARLSGVVLLVAGLSAAQLWPFLDLLAHSQRGPAYAGSLWSMPGWGWASFLVPLFHCYTTPQGVPLQAGQAFLPSYYVGVGTVALALLALVRVRDRRLRVLALVACLGLVWSLGENGRVFGWMRKALPWVGLTRFPIKFVYLVAFAAPFLAAYGLRSLRESGGQAPRQTLRWLAPLVGALWLAIAGLVWLGYSGPAPGENPGTTLVSGASRAVCLGAILGAAFLCVRQAPGRRRGISEAAVVVLAAADLWTHHPHLLPVIPSWAYREKVPLPQPVPGAGTARAFITPRAEGLLQTRTLREFLPDFLGSRLALWSNLNVLEGIPKVNGAATLQIREQAEVEWGLYGGTNEFPAVLRFLGVSHCSSPQSPVEWQPCPNPLPWVTVGQRPSFGSHEEALRTLFDPGFEPAETVCLPLEARGAFPAARRVPAQATGLRFSANEVEFRVDAPEATVAVVAQSYYPRWRAWVDGRPADLWRANGAFQAVAVPAGRHEVRLAYVDRGFHAGLVVSGISAAGCLALGLAGRRRMG